MNSNKFGTYISIGLIIIMLTVFIVFFGSISLLFNNITGYSFVSSTVFVLGAPEPPNLSAWVHNFGDWENGTVFLNWTPSASAATVSNYVIYRTFNYSQGFNFANQFTTSPNTQTNYIDTNASEYDEVYYILRANATYNIQDSNNYTWGKYTRPIYSNQKNGKMNLISLSSLPVSRSFDDVFIQNSSDYSVLQIYKRDDLTGEYAIASYYKIADAWYVPPTGITFTEIEPGRGYWIKSNSNTTWASAGYITKANQTFDLYSTKKNGKLTLVGWTSVVCIPFGEAVKQSPSDYNITQIYKRNDNTGEYPFVSYYAIADVWYGTDPTFTCLEPGHAYWFKSKNNVTWEYTPNVI